MISKDLIVCQEGSKEIPIFQEGKGEKMSSEMSSYQQGQLTEKEDQKGILIIGGIRIFLPGILVEARVCVANEASTTEGKPAMTIVKEELEQTLEAAQAEEEDENSKEWLNSFRQEDEKEITAALKLTTEEEHGDKYDHSMGDGVGNAGGLDEQSRATK
jgi:hypothetical protein